MPWRNGQGTTREIALGPAERGRFALRISVAAVAASGPFSDFVGYDRVIAVVRGDGMRLTVAGRAPVEMTPESAPFEFPGEAATTCALLGGPIVDFNLMTERSSCRGAVAALSCDAGPRELRLAGGFALLYAARGTLSLRGPDSLAAEIPEAAALKLADALGEVTISGAPDSRGLLATICAR